ncbi:glycoside hydrolase family 2 protein [Niastella populi]|uniref:Beta-glucuronidase n=1 Tax=Niastella populi TaxID=550983 RepID=A0A1V9FXD3_9BACT|nr:glycoside hydrolase family 2 TIM barrel-domain containing protein [Niastella populi]OQP62980.1 beta-glucuronidase [Niastella populi]
MRSLYLTVIITVASTIVYAQTPLITNIAGRKTTSLNGKWQYIIDPYGTGFYDYRFLERKENDREAYWNTDVPENKTDRKEHKFTDEYTLNVPGDWNSQAEKFLYYEGIVWYKKSFDFTKANSTDKVYLYFGASNYETDVYLNGKKLGKHKGGFTPFNFEVPDSVLKATGNYLVVKVDNTRHKDEVPTVNTDWWNYGGITRDVQLVEVPPAFIRDFTLQVQKGAALKTMKNVPVEGWVNVKDWQNTREVTVELPELKIKKIFPVTGERVNLRFNLPAMQLWSPQTPKLYTVVVSNGADRIEEKIGFRTIEVAGKQVLLNGKPLFMRGICMHEEIPQQIRRAYSKQDALQLLGYAKELGCNMVRLAHYPHNENMSRTADSMGILVWSEIPVYWTIDFTSAEVFNKARTQLTEMITRDRNRASIIIWSVGNETPVKPARTAFMRNLISAAKSLDSTRLVSAALEVNYQAGVSKIDDPLGEFVDIVSFNEYLGWYAGLPDRCRTAQWEFAYDKPFFISETGAETLYGFHGDSLTRWSEEYQEWYYREQVAMFKRMPENFAGLSPWLLCDFRSPRRNNQTFQEGWNNKGLIDQQGRKKKAFYVLKGYYEEKGL